MMGERGYQFFPSLDVNEYHALKEDIRQNGVRVPVEYDEEGNVLDGFHRVQICKELGITDFPSVVRVNMTEEEKIAHVFSLNANRRHLTDGQKRAIIADLLRDAPERSDRQIASMVSVSHPTVGKVRAEMEKNGQVVSVTTTIGADGVEQRRAKKNKTKEAPKKEAKQASLFHKTEKAREKAMNQTRQLIQAAAHDPEKYDDLIDLVADTGRTHNAFVEMKRRRRAEETAEKAKTAKPSKTGRVILADNMKIIPDESIDLICTDPPYNISYERVIQYAADDRQATSMDKGEWDHYDDTDFEYNMLHWSEEFYRVLKNGGSLYAFCGDANISYFRAFLIAAGFNFKNVLTWHFTNPKPRANKTSWIAAADHILFSVKGTGHTFNWTAVPLMHSVLRFGTCQGNERRDHPTQKPLKLIQKLIETSSNPGDVVLDPFAGSGTTGEACQNLDRSFVLIEKVPEYVQIIEERTGVKHEGCDDLHPEAGRKDG